MLQKNFLRCLFLLEKYFHQNFDHFLPRKNFQNFLLKTQNFHFLCDYYIACCYLDYLDFCKELTQREEYEEIHNHICKEVEYPMSKFRTAELIMFSTKNDTKSNEK